MKVKFKNWYRRNENGNTHIPLLAFGFNSESFWLALLGFSISIWRDNEKH